MIRELQGELSQPGRGWAGEGSERKGPRSTGQGGLRKEGEGKAALGARLQEGRTGSRADTGMDGCARTRLALRRGF